MAIRDDTSSDGSSDPTDRPPLSAQPPAAVTSPRNDVELGSRTHEGKVREKNEDAKLYFEPEDEELFRHKGRLLAIADGMGGHRAGEVASRVAMEALVSSYLQHPSEDPGVALDAALAEANRRIYQQGTENELERGMGTTCTALVHRGDSVYIAHVGDSRAYLIRGRSASQLTRDHATPQGLLRALGAEDSVDVELNGPLTVRDNDVFVVCSDGLTRYFDGIDIRNVLDGSTSAQEACDELVRRTLEEGAIDNVTLQILRIRTGTPGNGLAPTESLNDTQPLSLDLLQDEANAAPTPPPARAEPGGSPLRTLLLIVLALLLALAAVLLV